jgi:hypothetical protein
MAKKKSIENQADKEAIAIVEREKTNWEDAVSFITPKVGFRMRELIRICRKNYWGVFDNPIDKNTNRERVWIGLIMSTVETWLKNIDMDQKDIGFIARNDKGYSITEITRLVVKDYLDKIYFGETIDADERTVLIDGTVVWKTWEDNSSGKVVMKRKTVDLLNFYIDPTEENIQTAYRVTERSVALPEQIEAMTGWENTDDLTGSQIINKVDGTRRSNFGTRTTGEFRDVWETWGKIPKWLVTKDKKAEDANEEIDGHIVVSGFEAGELVCHLIEENKRKDKFGNSIKPYEEWRACKIAGRWYGLGVAERLLSLQEYLNTIVNIRINRSYVSQLGLFKIKKGKGITPKILSNLPSNGAIQVTDMDDIQQFQVDEASEASYKDEEVIKYWTQQVSSAYPISSGEVMPASTSATAVSTANANSKSAYTMFKESTGAFLERWIDRGALPIIAKTIKAGDLFKLTSDDENYKKLIESIAINTAIEKLDKSNVVPTHDEINQEIDAEIERLMKKPQLLIKNIQQIIAEGLDTKVKITNEDLDTGATIQNLINMMGIAPEYKDGIIKQIYDLMGLNTPKSTPLPQQMPTQPQPNQQMPDMSVLKQMTQ